MLTDKDLLRRLLARSERLDTGCLVWRGAHSKGYGFIRTGSRGADRKIERVHRLMWRLVYGPIEAGLEISHIESCGRRDCVEATHLVKLTHDVAIARGNTGENHRSVQYCPHGHAYSPANTRYRKDGRRVCRACESIRRVEKKRGGEQHEALSTLSSSA